MPMAVAVLAKPRSRAKAIVLGAVMGIIEAMGRQGRAQRLLEPAALEAVPTAIGTPRGRRAWRACRSEAVLAPVRAGAAEALCAHVPLKRSAPVIFAPEAAGDPEHTAVRRLRALAQTVRAW